MYRDLVPKLWNDTIDAHRREVRDAILDTTATLVFQHGLRSVTMARIATDAGIGRATLYKYFPDVETILRTWHERQITGHLAQLAEARDQATNADERLDAVLLAYAHLTHQRPGHHDADLMRFLHGDDHLAHAQRHLHELFRDLLAEAALAGTVRTDLTADELATYCAHALGAAGDLPTEAAVRRLVAVVRAGLRPPPNAIAAGQ